MWNKIKNFLLYATLDREQFDKVKPMVAAENAFALKLAAIVQILYFGASFFSSLGVEDMANKRLAYGIGTAVPLVLLIVYLAFSKKHDLVPYLIRCYGAGLFAAGLLCTLICTPSEMTILLLIFFFCIPMLFILQPIDLILLVLATDLIYFVDAPILKAPEVLTIDMIDVGAFSTLSVILGVTHMGGRYRRYWLETEAMDLAEVRYQAAFFDQLTGAFNRNAYNRDTEKMAGSPLADDFMYIGLDLNRLKDANDTFGHVAGDELITGAVDCMQKSFGEYGTVYRTGGDEFVVMLNTRGRTEGEILENFNRTVGTWSGNLVKKLSVAYGVVKSSEAQKMTMHEIELLADKRMYQAKADYYKNCGEDGRSRHYTA